MVDRQQHKKSSFMCQKEKDKATISGVPPVNAIHVLLQSNNTTATIDFAHETESDIQDIIFH